MSNAPVPLRPDPAALAARAARTLARALIGAARAEFESDRSIRRAINNAWPTDADNIAAILKSATTPASTSSMAVLLQTIIESSVLGAIGAGAALLARGTVMNFNRNATISLPILIADASQAAWVAELSPTPTFMDTIGMPVTMTPHKLMSLFVLSREIIESSNAETLVGECARRSIGLALDATLFDAVAGDATRPAGLRSGVTASPASAAADPYVAMLQDIGTLLAAVGVVGGPITLIAGTTRAAMLPLMTRGGVLPVVLGSPSLAAGDLIAVATDALVCAIDSTIEITTSKAATIHMDTAPTQIGTVGTPNVVAAPVRNLFQTDSVGLRLRLPVTWAKRHVNAVAWLTAAW